MIGKGLGQRAVRGVGLGDHHDAAGLLVEAVHDARPLDPADARKAVAAMVDQRVDQRAGPVAGAGMHDQTGRLVDDDDVVVLVEDVERRSPRPSARARPARAWRRRRARRPRPCGSAPVAGLPPTLTAPWRISAWTRLRETPASAAASHWSRRCPAASAGTINPPSASLSGALIDILTGNSPLGATGLRRRNRGKAARPGRRARAQEAGPLRRDQSRPAVRRPYGGGRGDCLQGRRRRRRRPTARPRWPRSRCRPAPG